LAPETATNSLLASIRACTVCSDFLAAGPRPIVQFSDTARIVIIGQAPGSKVHASGVPWNDDSGDRLREWTGLSKDLFYDAAQVALVPMGFCYPGKGKSGDLPPRPECAPLWHSRIMALLPTKRLTLLVGTYAQKAYLQLPKGATLTETVRTFDGYGPDFLPLPHPAWRSVIWMRRNPWFEQDVLPAMRSSLRALVEAA
jgi:uracil-DNA glycosylase